MELIVDAMNVIGSRPTGWWRDRDAAKRRFVERLRDLAGEWKRPIAVVIDGHPLPDLPEGEWAGLVLHYADQAGPNAADDLIVEMVAEHPARVTVVTSDRELRRRVSELGVKVNGSSWLLDQLDQLDRLKPESRDC